MKQEGKQNVFLALTKMHRDIKNGEDKIKFHPLFNSFGIKNPNLIVDIKKAMLKMKLIRIHKDGSVEWNSEKCLPNPQLVNGILLTIKQMKEEEKVRIKIKVEPSKDQHLVILINGIPCQADRTSIAW